MNMGVAVGLLPTKGLTLPFVSMGGSSLIVCCAATGVLLNISRGDRAVKAARARAVEDGGQRAQDAPDDADGAACAIPVATEGGT
jgi:cell division protein FtsW